VERGVELPPDGGDVGGDAGRGLVVRDEDRLDLAVAVAAEPAAELGHGTGRAPRRIDGFDDKAETFGHCGPEAGERAVPRHQHLVARRQRVGDRRFPGRRSRSRDQRDAHGPAAKDGGARSRIRGRRNSAKAGER
jgi:hypothetical protein